MYVVLHYFEVLLAITPMLGGNLFSVRAHSFAYDGIIQVSVSEFMSLVKALTGRRRYSTTARAWVGGFDRKQAYRLLRCVDKDGDRRVALRDLVVFIFVTWTAELSRLARDEGQDQHVQNVQDVRQRRRQLQKVSEAF